MKPTRRAFLGCAASLAAFTVCSPIALRAARLRLRLGVFVNLEDKDPEQTMSLVRSLGLDLCEIYTNRVDPDSAELCRKAMEKHKVRASALFTSGPGEMVWDLKDGPGTIGVVPRKNRAARVAALKQASDFAKVCGIPAFETHIGFIPEDPRDPLYAETVEATREVVAHCQKNGQLFLYHAGQETPLCLVRMMRDVGLDNQRVGLDTANLVLCGRGNPVDALEIYGNRLGAINAKDGLFPTDPDQIGKETPLGEGKVDFPALFKKLESLSYRGPVIIERENAGATFPQEIQKAKKYLAQFIEVD